MMAFEIKNGTPVQAKKKLSPTASFLTSTSGMAMAYNSDAPQITHNFHDRGVRQAAAELNLTGAVLSTPVKGFVNGTRQPAVWVYFSTLSAGAPFLVSELKRPQRSTTKTNTGAPGNDSDPSGCTPVAGDPNPSLQPGAAEEPEMAFVPR